MDCCICSAVIRSSRNSLCSSCYEGGLELVGFLNDLDAVDSWGPETETTASAPTTMSSLAIYIFKANNNVPSRGLNHALNRVKQMRERVKEERERSEFLAGMVDAMRNGMHTDIVLKPGRSTGAPISAHKALLATRSEVLKNMFCSEVGKAPAAADDSIPFPELSHEELRCLLEFLYTGTLPPDLAEQQQQCSSSSLLLAADKYGIPFLRKLAERRILSSLVPANALDVLEVSEMCSSSELKQQAINTIVDHAEDVLLSHEYGEFAAKNARLCVEITRALLSKMKVKKEPQAGSIFL